jgi:hypothetical protein
LGAVSVPLTSIVQPEKLTLEVAVDSLSNNWDFWVYPAKKQTLPGEAKIRVVQKLDASALEFLKRGGSVLLNLKKGTISPEMGGNIAIGFSSIFWKRRGQAARRPTRWVFFATPIIRRWPNFRPNTTQQLAMVGRYEPFGGYRPEQLPA